MPAHKPSAAFAERPRSTRNAGAGQLIGTSLASQSEPAGYGLSGAGVQVGVWDDGHARASHVDLRGRLRGRDLGGPSMHATHTTATLAGSGAGEAAARGVAVAARVWSYDWLLDMIEMEAAAAWLSVSSNAYGPTLGWSVASSCPDRAMWWGGGAREDPAFGRYGSEAASADALVQRTDLLLVWPAGNERLDAGPGAGTRHYHAGSCDDLFTDLHVQERTLQFGTLGGASLAKNVLTVGAARKLPADALSPERIVPMDVSSFGPSDDGRIKPDLLAGGDGVRSASVEADDSYAVLEGTSSATAAAAGAIALLTELYRDTHGGADPRAPELKALLVHSAREAGSSPGPDYGAGHGLLDASAAAALIDADGAAPAGVRQLWIGALDGAAFELTTAEPVPVGRPLRITLAWTDPPSPPDDGGVDARPGLVNDLDLVITRTEGGEEARFHPWSLDPQAPTSDATRDAPNRRDNVEVVDVPSGAAGGGALRIEVREAHALWRARPQAFALVASVLLVAAGASAERPVLAAPRYVSIEATAGERPEPARIALGNRGAGTLSFRARARAPWIAVSPQEGEAPAELEIEIDPALFEGSLSGEALGAVEIDGNDAEGPRTIGVIWRAACDPDCSNRNCGPDARCGESCGSCRDGASCADGVCVDWAGECPRADLGGQLGPALASGDAQGGSGSQAGTCGGAAPGDSSFTWTAPEAGRYAFTTRGSEHDTVLYVQDGTCSGTELACNDDSGAPASALALELEAGAQVTAVVDAFDAERTGTFRLNIERAPCPSVELGGRVGLAVARGSTAGGIDDLAGSCGGEGSEDVALAWTAKAAGRYRFALFDPRFQAVLYVREGGCDGDELGCSAAADVGPVEVELEAGEVVTVVVDGREGQRGDFTLDVFALGEGCAAACGGASGSGACACDAECVAASDCCADACELCGHCRCQPSCAGRSCGTDSCGGSCGECAAREACADGRCVADPCAGVQCDACSACIDGACRPLAEGAACEDGDACTVLDACRDGRCEGSDRRCDDGFDCTRDHCEPRSGACVFELDDGCCDHADCPDGGCADGDPRCPAGAEGGRAYDGGTDGGGQPRAADSGGCGCHTVGSGASSSLPAAAGFTLLVAAIRGLRRRQQRRRAHATDA